MTYKKKVKIMSEKMKLENEDLQEFVLDDTTVTEEGTSYEVMGSSDEILKFDFSSDKEFKLEESYEIVEQMNKIKFEKKSTDSEIKHMEAENIVKDTAEELIDGDGAKIVAEEYANMKALLRRYSTENDEIKNMTDSERNKIFGIASYVFDEHSVKYKDLIFKFDLTRKEYKFLTNVFNRLEYGPDEIFQLDKLKQTYFSVHEGLDKKIPKDIDIIPTRITVNMIVILYHLVSLYKVKGVTEEFYIFRDILSKIGDRIKLLNAYNVLIERLSNDFAHWTTTLNALDEIQDTSDLESVVIDNVEEKNNDN